MKSKIEFWISAPEKERFVNLCKQCGYTVAEVMRRIVERQIEEMEEKCKKKN